MDEKQAYIDKMNADLTSTLKYLGPEGLGKLALALSKAQGEIRSAEKDARNPHYNSPYATLASVWDACRGPLSKNELAVVQCGETDGSGSILVTRLIHSSGQFITSVVRIKATKDDMQGLGSAWTYARRYALAAIVGVAPDDDDDGEASIAARPRKTEEPKRPSQADWDRNPGWESQTISEKQLKLLHVKIKEAQASPEIVKAFCIEKFRKESSKLLTKGEFQTVLSWLEQPSKPQPNAAERAVSEAFAPLPFEKGTE